MSTGPTIEILDGQGAGEPPPGPGWLQQALSAASRRLVDRLSRRQRAALVVTAALGVVGAVGTAAVRSMPAEPLPAVSVQGWDGVQQPWQRAGDGRPKGPAVLAATLRVEQPVPAGSRAAPAAVEEVRVLGLDGPGVVRNESAPVRVVAGGDVAEVPLRTVLDCERVPDVVPADAYRLLVDAGRPGAPEGGRHRGPVVAGEVADRWGRAAQAACTTWRARHALTVTAVEALPDPTRTRAALALTVANAGSRPAMLGRVEGTPVRIDRGNLPVTVPAGGTATVRVEAGWDDCTGVGSADRGFARLGTDLLGLTARTGPMPPVDDLEDVGVVTLSGVALAPAAVSALDAARDRVCAGIGVVAAKVAAGGTRVDRRTGRADLQVELSLPPGRVRSVRLVPAQEVVVRALWTRTGDLAPDPSGTVRTTLAYAVGGEHDCNAVDGQDVEDLLPTVRATLQVPDGAAVREVAVLASVDLRTDPTLRRWLCLPAR